MTLAMLAPYQSGHAADVLIDPTRPVSAASIAVSATHPDQLRVEAILDRDGRRIAIVAGQVVRAGDHCSWGDIQEITTTGIRYVHAGRVQFIQLENHPLSVRRASVIREAMP